MHEQGVTSAWLIGTHAAIRKHTMGMAKAAPLQLGRYLANGYLKKAALVRDLAAQIGVDPDTLAATVETFNRYADAGHDPDYGRGAVGFSAQIGRAPV